MYIDSLPTDKQLSLPIKERTTDITAAWSRNYVIKTPVYKEYSEIIWVPVGREGYTLLASTPSAHIRTRRATDKTRDQKITNKPNPDHSRCWKWFLLLRMRSLHLSKVFTFMCWNSFSERKETGNLVGLGVLYKASKSLAQTSFEIFAVSNRRFDSAYFCRNNCSCFFFPSVFDCNFLKFMSQSSPYFSHWYRTLTLFSIKFNLVVILLFSPLVHDLTEQVHVLVTLYIYAREVPAS
jgi:hypothetical protein